MCWGGKGGRDGRPNVGLAIQQVEGLVCWGGNGGLGGGPNVGPAVQQAEFCCWGKDGTRRNRNAPGSGAKLSEAEQG